MNNDEYNANPYSAPVSEVLNESTAEEAELILASRWARLFAYIIDVIMLFLTSIFIGVILSFIVSDTFLDSANEMTIGVMVISVYMLINGSLLVMRGQTVGKLILRIRIVNPSTKKVPGFVDVVLKRYVAFMVLSLLPLISLVTIINPFMIFRETKKCWHDDFANTIVVKA